MGSRCIVVVVTVCAHPISITPLLCPDRLCIVVVVIVHLKRIKYRKIGKRGACKMGQMGWLFPIVLNHFIQRFDLFVMIWYLFLQKKLNVLGNYGKFKRWITQCQPNPSQKTHPVLTQTSFWPVTHPTHLATSSTTKYKLTIDYRIVYYTSYGNINQLFDTKYTLGKSEAYIEQFWYIFKHHISVSTS